MHNIMSHFIIIIFFIQLIPLFYYLMIEKFIDARILLSDFDSHISEKDSFEKGRSKYV